MSDSRLRELERRWRETGSVEDEAAWLRARVQAGELDQSRLELAAHLGDLLSRELLGLGPQPPIQELQPWAKDVGQWGREPCVRVGLAGARAGVRSWDAKRKWRRKRTVATWSNVDPREVLAQLEARLLDPAVSWPDLEVLPVGAPPFLKPLGLIKWIASTPLSSRDRWQRLPEVYAPEEAQRLVQAFGARGVTVQAESAPDVSARRLRVGREGLPSSRELADAFRDLLGYEGGTCKAAVCNLEGLNDYDAYTSKVFRELEWAKLKPVEVVRIVRADVVPWALEKGDPVRDRVEGRQ